MFCSQRDMYEPKLGPYNAMALEIASELPEFLLYNQPANLASEVFSAHLCSRPRKAPMIATLPR